MSASKINILIPTLNEAGHIAETVINAARVGDVFVLDSQSTDGTQQIAREAGATVVEHAWEGYARQKNWGLKNIEFTGEWIFILDADERITPELREELLALVEKGTDVDGWYVNRLNLLLGQPVRHGGLYPSWNLRFFRKGSARYEDRSVHEHMVCDGQTGYLKEEMLHIRRETIAEYIQKHIRYADLESDEWVKLKLKLSTGADADKLFRDILRARQWLRRHIWPKCPFRPLLRFAYMYIIRFGVLDGYAGFHLAMLMANYEYMISLLYRDKLHRIKLGNLKPPGVDDEQS